ncbi:MAG: hypothetical protein C4583_14980 [Anaerolineaceae bacterium]|nr:MAG: hypothetical protein C4583_14980 [Anaerolineaceae bacterium]
MNTRYKQHAMMGVMAALLLLVGCAPQETAAPTPIPSTKTPILPTQMSVPPSPTAVSVVGKTFTGPLGDGGTITFTVSEDGLTVEGGIALLMKNISCTEGGGNLIELKITIPHSFQIIEMKFRYGSDNMFQAGYGMELIGQFDSSVSVHGTFKYQDTNRPPTSPCTYGPYEWTANAQ